MKRKLLLLVVLLFPFAINAKEITNISTIKLDGSAISSYATDNKERTYTTIKKDQTITIESNEIIKGIYIEYEISGGSGVLSNDTSATTFGINEFAHDYIDVSKLLGDSKKVSLKYNSKVSLTDIHVIGEGELPSFVEIWEAPAEKADLLLFSTHSDDEQLFFSGLMPHYVAKGAIVQVVYFANHKSNQVRYHELLHGLYTVGVRHYPIIGDIPDEWADDLKEAIRNAKAVGITEQDAMDFVVEQIRRFKPLVIVGHDEKGEYGHGQHIFCTYILERAIDNANDSTYHTESYEKYGKWATKKVYIHLYPKNKIVMEYDTPLDYFNGKTAFNVSQEGFRKHNSQQYTWFRKWMYGKDTPITKSTQIKTYSPREYGLFRSLVGPDNEKNDMFENLDFYKNIDDVETYFNKEVEQTIAEEPMVKVEDNEITVKQVLLIVAILLSGTGLVVLARKL
jgi:LmbE family N-acetylglucosaminyl deacetylase